MPTEETNFRIMFANWYHAWLTYAFLGIFRDRCDFQILEFFALSHSRREFDV